LFLRLRLNEVVEHVSLAWVAAEKTRELVRDLTYFPMIRAECPED